MMNNSYESHNHCDPTFPIIFHYDTAYSCLRHFETHWHENIEILFFTHGNAFVSIDELTVTASVGDMIVINPNSIHTVYTNEEFVKYYCLIIGKDFCDTFDFPMDDIKINEKIRDDKASEVYLEIVNEFDTKGIYYKSAVKGFLLTLLTKLCRNYCVEKANLDTHIKDSKIHAVKKTIKYIRIHYGEPLTIDDISFNVGFSKYYFCHIFKDITGTSIISYINFIRCENAKRILLTGENNVNEVAGLCGFENISYFTKTYKKQFGELPSAVKKTTLSSG